MAISDDIAEKVSDLLIQETAKAGAKIIDTAPGVVDGIYHGGKDLP